MLADFGLASERISYATLLQSVVGTISYSCPEIVQHHPYTDKADIWSLGCILYQMAQLEPPFAGGNPLTVAHKVFIFLKLTFNGRLYKVNIIQLIVLDILIYLDR